MLSFEHYKNSKSIKDIVKKLFESRQVAHSFHLQTKSYSIHKALNNFYEEILDLTDKFVEAYQGQYGILTGYENIEPKQVKDIIPYLSECAKIFIEGRESMKESHLKNIMEEIITLTYTTLYKLENLK
jgi:hypothetical protein